MLSAAHTLTSPRWVATCEKSRYQTMRQARRNQKKHPRRRDADIKKHLRTPVLLNRFTKNSNRAITQRHILRQSFKKDPASMADETPVVNLICVSKPGDPIQPTRLTCANIGSSVMNRPLNILAMAQTRRRYSLIPQFQASPRHAGGLFHTDLGKTPRHRFIPVWGRTSSKHAETLRYENKNNKIAVFIGLLVIVFIAIFCPSDTFCCIT